MGQATTAQASKAPMVGAVAESRQAEGEEAMNSPGELQWYDRAVLYSVMVFFVLVWIGFGALAWQGVKVVAGWVLG